jgi:hypothetical protein
VLKAKFPQPPVEFPNNEIVTLTILGDNVPKNDNGCRYSTETKMTLKGDQNTFNKLTSLTKMRKELTAQRESLRQQQNEADRMLDELKSEIQVGIKESTVATVHAALSELIEAGFGDSYISNSVGYAPAYNINEDPGTRGDRKYRTNLVRSVKFASMNGNLYILLSNNAIIDPDEEEADESDEDEPDEIDEDDDSK